MSLRNCEEHRHESREKYFQHRKDVFQEVPASLFKWAGKIYQPNNVWCWIASTSTKKNVPPLLPERKQKKNLKIEGTNSLIACTSRLGKQKRFLTDPNFDLGFTRRRTCPATSRSGLCPSRKRPCTATRQPEGAELTPTSRKAQLQQHNPWLPLRSHSHKEIGYTVELLFLPNLQPYVETWTAKITLWNAQNLKRDTSSLQHHQMKNPTPGCSTGRWNQQAHGAWRHLPDLKLPCVSPCQPWAPSARLSVPRTQTCSRATVSDMKTSQLSTFQTKWTLPCWCNHWQAQLSLLWTEKKNHLHSQTEAKCHFANISRKGIVLCLPNISRRYYGGVGSLLMSDNSIKMYHSDKKNIYIFSVVHFWKEASWHTNRWCIEQVTNTCSNKNVCNFFHWAFKIYWQQ